MCQTSQWLDGLNTVESQPEPPSSTPLVLQIEKMQRSFMHEDDLINDLAMAEGKRQIPTLGLAMATKQRQDANFDGSFSSTSNEELPYVVSFSTSYTNNSMQGHGFSSQSGMLKLSKFIFNESTIPVVLVIVFLLLIFYAESRDL